MATKQRIIDIAVVLFAFIVAATTFYSVKDYPVREYLAEQLERISK